MATEKLTEYERRRLENIRRNDEMMAALNVHAKASLLSSAIKRPRVERRTYNKKNKPETPTVTRRSLRTRGLKPDVDGLPDDFSEVQKSVNPTVLGPLPFEAAYEGTDSDRQFVDTILDIAKKSTVARKGKRRCTRSSGRLSSVVESETSDSSYDTAKNQIRAPAKLEKNERVLDVESLTLEPENVARMVPGRILVVKFLPCADVKMIAAGDKFGNVGFWNLDIKDEEENGIFLYSPHKAPVSSILFQQSSLSKVITSCYDGLIRQMDAEKSVFDLIYSSDDAIISLSQHPDDNQSLYFGEGNGGFKIWDIRAGKSSFNWNLHEQRINSVDFNPQNPRVMATSSTDRTACLWDLRCLGSRKPKKLNIVHHAKPVHSAYFSPSGLSLATTSTDDNIGILSGSNFEDISMIRHNNQTGRWISSFRGIWGWDDSHVFIGQMSRGIDVISAEKKRIVKTLHSPLVSAIPSRFHSHPYNVGLLAGATAGGQVYVWTSSSN